MSKICPQCRTANSADAARCGCGYDWPGNSRSKPSTGAAIPEAHFRRLVKAGVQLVAGPLKFKLFQVLAIALFLVVLACGVGFMEAKNPVARTLFAAGFVAAFGVAAVGIVWFRDKLT